MTIDSEAERSGIEDAAAYLARHGVRASTEIVPKTQVNVPEDLMEFVQKIGAGMLVMGAYGHSRFGEWVLGGVTADFLAGTPVCCLMSH